jgi:hypothetical protein
MRKFELQFALYQAVSILALARRQTASRESSISEKKAPAGR